MRISQTAYGTNSLIPKKVIDNIVLFFLFIYISNTASICFEQTFSFALIGLFCAFFLLKKRQVDPFIVGIGIYWFFINFLYSNVFNESWVFNKVLGGLIPLTISYLGFKIIGSSFWYRFEKWVFVLTSISLVFYGMQLLFPFIFESLSSVFGKFIADFYTEARPTAWYVFVYTYSPIAGLAYVRNSGFMWEPGAFAMICIIAIIYRSIVYGVKIDKYLIIYLIAILTTMSTAGYLALVLYLLFYIRYSEGRIKTILFLLLFICAIPFVFQLEFIGEKLNDYLYNSNVYGNTNERLDTIEYDRFTVFRLNMERLLYYPLGYGVYNIKDDFGYNFVGVNGIATFARMWGVAGISFMLIGIYKTLKKMYRGTSFSWLFVLMLLIVFFSNPIERSPLFFVYLMPFCRIQK